MKCVWYSNESCNLSFLGRLDFFASKKAEAHKTHSHIAIVVRPLSLKSFTNQKLVKSQSKILFTIEVGNYNLWVCYKGMAFWDGDNFCKAFA